MKEQLLYSSQMSWGFVDYYEKGRRLMLKNGKCSDFFDGTYRNLPTGEFIIYFKDGRKFAHNNKMERIPWEKKFDK